MKRRCCGCGVLSLPRCTGVLVITRLGSSSGGRLGFVATARARAQPEVSSPHHDAHQRQSTPSINNHPSSNNISSTTIDIEDGTTSVAAKWRVDLAHEKRLKTASASVLVAQGEGVSLPTPLAKIKSTLGDAVEEDQEEFRRHAHDIQLQLESTELVRPCHRARREVLMVVEALQERDAKTALEQLVEKEGSSSSSGATAAATPLPQQHTTIPTGSQFQRLISTSVLDLSALMYCDPAKPFGGFADVDDPAQALAAFAHAHGSPALGRALRGALFSIARREGIIVFVTGLAQLLQSRSFFELFASELGNCEASTDAHLLADLSTSVEFILGLHRWVCDAAVSLLPLVVQQYEASSEATRLLHATEEVLRLISGPFLRSFRDGLRWVVGRVCESGAVSREEGERTMNTCIEPYFTPSSPGHHPQTSDHHSHNSPAHLYLNAGFYKSHFLSGQLLTPPLIQSRRLTAKDLSSLATSYAQLYDAPRGARPSIPITHNGVTPLRAVSARERHLASISFGFEPGTQTPRRIRDSPSTVESQPSLDFAAVSDLKVLEAEIVRRFRLAFEPYVPPTPQQLRALEEKAMTSSSTGTDRRFSVKTYMEAHQREFERGRQRSLLTLTDVGELATAFAVMRFTGTLSPPSPSVATDYQSNRSQSELLRYSLNFWDSAVKYTKVFIAKDFELYVQMVEEDGRHAPMENGNVSPASTSEGDEGDGEYLPVTFSRADLRSICFALCQVRRVDLYDDLMAFLTTDVDELLGGKGGVLAGLRILPHPLPAPLPVGYDRAAH